MSTKHEDRGLAPVVLAPFRPLANHRLINLTKTPVSIQIPNDDCVTVMIQSTGSGEIRVTFDGTDPTDSVGFVLNSSMPPTVLNVCGHHTRIKFVGSKDQGCVVQFQLAD